MSIATQKARIKGNVTAALAEIAGKGVTVPEGSTSDALAGLIKAIEAGGGGGAENIIIGSFTPLEVMAADTYIDIDVPFPMEKFPFMYAVFEDSRLYGQFDTTHAYTKLVHLISTQIKDQYEENTRYITSTAYCSAGSFTTDYYGSSHTHINSGYDNAGGIYGSMDISLDEHKIRFVATSKGKPYLQGRTYYYILYWE